MGVYIPGLLLCSAIFFATRLQVDRYNLDNGVWALGFQSLGNFSRVVQLLLRLTVAAWWLLIGLGVLLYSRSFADQWDSWLPKPVVLAMSYALVPASMVLTARSMYVYSSMSGADSTFAEYNVKTLMLPKPIVESMLRCLDKIFGELVNDADPRDHLESTPSFNDARDMQLNEDDWDVRYALGLESQEEWAERKRAEEVAARKRAEQVAAEAGRRKNTS
eukprot:TRINITY_DN43221_c0_g1_i1.p1 TRINITY_DN43221_c0_g1~~TRINITY_DN43221_c0_g1_i1.p1  ORF type:complete len:247 (-),score=37.06 TRINITY_DN43221_c0_g1_i1:64-720(-)